MKYSRKVSPYICGTNPNPAKAFILVYTLYYKIKNDQLVLFVNVIVHDIKY